MFQNFMRYANLGLQALMILPALLSTIHQSVEAVEAIAGPGTGAAKKQAVLEAVDAAFDVMEGMAAEPLGIDRTALRGLSANLVETTLGLRDAAQKRGA